MPKRIKHIFQTPVTGKTPGKTADGYGGDDWYELRIELLEKYTIPSLLKQTKQNFLWWLTFRPEELFNPLTKKVVKLVKDSGIDNIMSFNGTMFTEDRAVWHNEDLKERLAMCLPEVKKVVGKVDYIYETNLDSDDMLHHEFSEIVQGKKYKNRGALYMKKGFAYNTQGRIADWENPEAQQNYTIMFPQDVYFDQEKRLGYLKGFKSHEEVPKKFKADQLPDGMFCTIIHGKNVSTVWEHPFRKEERFYEDEKDTILKNFI